MLFEIIKKIENFIYVNLKFKKEREFLFTYLSQGLRNGASSKELLDSILIEYYRNKKYRMIKYLEDVIENMEDFGYSDIESMYRSGLISEIELHSIENIAKEELHKAMDFINTKTRNENSLKWAVGMLFFPSLLVILGYIIYQPELKALTEQLLSPVNNVSTEAIKIPEYFHSRTVFIQIFVGIIFVMASFFLVIEYLKKYNIKLLFKIFRITEREFVINNFESFLSLLKSGQNRMRAVELLSVKTDKVSGTIFTDMKTSLREGDVPISEIFLKYGMDPATISYMHSGERNNFLEESIEMILSYNIEKYDKLVKRLTKVLPLIGEIVMTLIILIPLIDIINVTTVGAMNFKV